MSEQVYHLVQEIESLKDQVRELDQYVNSFCDRISALEITVTEQKKRIADLEEDSHPPVAIIECIKHAIGNGDLTLLVDTSEWNPARVFLK